MRELDPYCYGQRVLVPSGRAEVAPGRRYDDG